MEAHRVRERLDTAICILFELDLNQRDKGRIRATKERR